MSISTTVVGSWPIPFGLRPNLKKYYAGEISDNQADSLLARAARIAMDEQIACGLDEIMGGEVFAPDFLHHVPPRLSGLKTLQARNTARGYEGVGIYEVDGKITAPIGTGHAKAFRRESAIEPNLHKASVPSPLTIGGGFRSQNSAYLIDMIELVQKEISDTVAAGATEIQLDAPSEAIGLVGGSRTVAQLLPLIVEPLSAAVGVRRSIHFCLGDIARAPAIEEQNLRNLLPLIQKLDGVIDKVHVECSYPGQWQERRIFEEFPDSMIIIAGIADVKSPPASEIALREKIESLLSIIPREKLIVSSSCGCGRVPHDEAIRLMRNLVKAAALV